MKDKKLLAIILLSLVFCLTSNAKGGEIEEGGMLSVGLIAPIISAVCALLAVWAALGARSFMRRTERPIISLFDDLATLKDFTICLKFKNTGKHPATKVKVHMLGCYNSASLKPKKIGKKGVHITNRKDPGMSFSYKEKIPYKKIEDLLFYVHITYQDVYTTKDYCDNFKLICKKGKSTLQDMDIADWNKMRKKIPRKFQMNSKGKN